MLLILLLYGFRRGVIFSIMLALATSGRTLRSSLNLSIHCYLLTHPSVSVLYCLVCGATLLLDINRHTLEHYMFSVLNFTVLNVQTGNQLDPCELWIL